MKRGIIIAATTIALALALPIAAQATDDDECDLALTTRDMTECYEVVAKNTERQLNVAFGRLLRRTHGRDMQTALIHAQQGWTNLRNHDCDASADEGTIRGASIAVCLAAKNRERTKEINATRKD